MVIGVVFFILGPSRFRSPSPNETHICGRTGRSQKGHCSTGVQITFLFALLQPSFKKLFTSVFLLWVPVQNGTGYTDLCTEDSTFPGGFKCFSGIFKKPNGSGENLKRALGNAVGRDFFRTGLCGISTIRTGYESSPKAF